MEREEEEEGEAGMRKEKGIEKQRRERERGLRCERREVVMCVSTTETDDLPGERADRVRRVQRVGRRVIVVVGRRGGGGGGECEEAPRDREECGKKARARREHGGMKSSSGVERM